MWMHGATVLFAVSSHFVVHVADAATRDPSEANGSGDKPEQPA